MMVDLQLKARAILLEHYNAGLDVIGALKRVNAEVGANTFDEWTAHYLYEEFAHGRQDIIGGGTFDDEKMIKNGTFLKSQRAILHTTSTLNDNVVKQHGGNSRFQILRRRTNHFILDLFNGVEKKIEIHRRNSNKSTKPFMINEICFLKKNKIIGTMWYLESDIMRNRSYLFSATFDLATCRLTIKTRSQFCIINAHIFLNNARDQVSLLMRKLDSSLMQYSVLNMSSLKILNAIQVPFCRRCPTIRENKLYCLDWSHQKKLFEFSFKDETTREYDVAPNEVEASFVNAYKYVWVDNTLFAAHKNGKIGMFEISKLKWTETVFEVKGHVDSLLISNNILLVKTRFGLTGSLYYQFPIKVDKLTHMIWKSMRQYSESNPNFYAWFKTKLPKNFRHCPIY